MADNQSSAGSGYELLPCPFCGSRKIEIIDVEEGPQDGCRLVECYECFASTGSKVVGPTQDSDLIAAWNNRTAPVDRYDEAMAAIDDALACVPTNDAQGAALRAAAERVCWFDWSDNDMDAVAAIDALRKVITSQPSPAATVEERQVSCAPGGQPYAKAHEGSSAGSAGLADLVAILRCQDDISIQERLDAADAIERLSSASPQPSAGSLAQVLREARRFIANDPTRMPPSAMLARINEALATLDQPQTAVESDEPKPFYADKSDMEVARHINLCLLMSKGISEQNAGFDMVTTLNDAGLEAVANAIGKVRAACSVSRPEHS